MRVNWFLDVVVSDVEVLDLHKNVLLQTSKIRADIKSFRFRHHQLIFNQIAVIAGNINLRFYEADSSLNLQFIIDHFTSPEVDTSAATPWMVRCKNLKIEETHFSYRNERYLSPGKGMDYADLDFAKINLEMKDISLQGDSILADIRHLSCKEKSGIRLNDFSTKAMACPRGIDAPNLQIMTENSRLSLDLKIEYHTWNAFQDFIDSVTFIADIRPSQLDMRDIVTFGPGVDGMNEIFDFSGKVKGTIASFSAKNFNLAYAQHTVFKGNIKMTGLPDWEETFVHLKIDDFKTTPADIGQFTLPYTEGINTVALPEQITHLGNIGIKGSFTGFYNDFLSKATFTTDAGTVITDLLLTNNKTQHSSEYNGRVIANSLDIGKIFDLKQFSTLNLDATVKGKNFSLDDADLTIKGEITDVQYEGNNFGLISVDGLFKDKRFTGGVYMNDELLAFDFNGSADFSEKLPSFDFVANLLHANLSKLNLLHGDSTISLSTHTDFSFQGNNLDNLIGTLLFKNTSFTNGHKTLHMNLLTIKTISLGAENKRMQINSDFADAEFTGKFTFDDMAEYLTLVFTNYLPSLSITKKQPERINKGSFDYTINLHNTRPLTEMFAPKVYIDSKTEISGAFDPGTGLVNVNGKSPLIRVYGFSLRDWSLTGSSMNDRLMVRMGCGVLDMSDKIHRDTSANSIEQVRLLAIAVNDSVKFRFNWDDFEASDRFKGDVFGSVSFAQFPRLAVQFEKADIVINDTVWTAPANNLAIIDTAFIEIRNMGLTHQNQHMIINGIASTDPLNEIMLDFKEFNISNTDMLAKQYGIDLDGYLDGSVRISDLFSVPRITAGLKVNKFGFNNEYLGDAEIISTWDNEHQRLGVDTRVIYVGNAGIHYPVKAVGNIYPGRDHDNFDLKIDVDNLKMRTMEPFFTGLFSRIRGLASGAVTLTGDFQDPVLEGKVKLMRSELLVNYLRTSYSFAGDFNFDKDLMWFKNFELTDSTGSTGICSGTIKHHAFRDWALDISLSANHLAALNTPFNPREMYYGRARVSGNMTLKGPIDNLEMKTTVSSDKGTSIFVPISFARNISENDFIHYRNLKKTDDDNETTNPKEPSVFALQLGLDVTRDADIGIILPYQMGNIQVRGEGLISMGIDTRGDYTMHGQYTMDKGNFLFNFQNIFKRNFDIIKGGTIAFNGSPYNADINLQAVYKIKTTLGGLPNIPSEYSSIRIPVDCIISLTNSLYNPDIKFSINLPDATEDVKRRVYSAIDTSNSTEMNQQMISLLVLNSFSSTGGITANSGNLGVSSYEILSNQLNKWLSQISKDFDIGVKYRPGDQISPQELELALSTQLFNNRVTIEGSFGMNSSNSTSAQTSRLVGDVLVEVKITEDGRFRVKAFNRTNSTLDLYSAPYTQGVGFLYRKDFDNFRDLFRRKKKMDAVTTDKTGL